MAAHPEHLTRTLQDFLAGHEQAVVLEEGEILFSFDSAKFSVSGDEKKCLIHLWSEERNLVRRVLDCEHKNGSLLLKAQKFGQAKPYTLEFCSTSDRRSPSAKKSSRAAYQKLLKKVLEREYPGFKFEKLTNAPDLERSFGPIYSRALIRQGRSAFAVVGLGSAETQSSVDASLTTGLLWLDHCREHEAARCVVEGLVLVLPRRTSEVVRARAANLNQARAKFRVCELSAADAELYDFDLNDSGNIFTRLVRAPDERATKTKFGEGVARIEKLVPSCEVVVLSSTEVAFRHNGLEFARARTLLKPNSFAQSQEIVFGAGAYETPLTEDSESYFRELMQRVVAERQPGGDRNSALYRMQPERWLESLVRQDVTTIDSQLDNNFVYSQVPAFAASDRVMIDVLTCTQEGRLAVIELKASEDLHLPLQGLDYWARVNWHHQRREFQQYGYFAGRQLSPEPPLLYLVAPALHVHPTTDVLLRYLSPKIEWTLIGVDERWRDGVRVVFRKRANQPQRARSHTESC